MSQNPYRNCILQRLRERNKKESAYTELIKYSNKLLLTVDYLQKGGRDLDSRCTTEGISDTVKSDETILKTRCEQLQKELTECHPKISNLAQQVLELKDEVNDKNLLIARQTTQLQRLESEYTSIQELKKAHKEEVTKLRKALQDRIDEYDTLNMTYSSVENKRNDLENENRFLKTELSKWKLRRDSERTDSLSSNESLDRSVRTSPLKRSDERVPKVADLVKDVTVKKDVPQKLLSKLEPESLSDVVLPKKVKLDFTAHDSDVNAVLWLPDALNLITAGRDRRVKAWVVEDADVKELATVRGCNSAVLSVDVDADVSLLLASSADFASRVWSLPDFTLRHTLTGHSGKVTSAKFIKGRLTIASGSTDHTLKLWDFGRRASTVTYSSHSSVNDVLSRDANVVLSGHADGKIRLWDTRVDSETGSIPAAASITSLDASRNGHLLMASTRDNRLRIFDFRTCKELNSLSARHFVLESNMPKAKISPNDRHVACGSSNGTVFVWNVSTGIVEEELKAHHSAVIACAWSSCGAYLASTDSTKKCVIWSK